MIKRILILLVSLALALLPIYPSNSAVIKNGVNCSKPNVITRVSGRTYVCTKNPYVKPNRNTWTLQNCVTARGLLKDAKEEYESWKDLAKLAGDEGIRTLEDLARSITDLEKTMRDVACRRGA